MQKIDFQVFDQFHIDFKGDTANTFPICKECGGGCEYTKISSLLPGEAEYMAQKHGCSIEEFRSKYLDGLRVDDYVLDILKCSDPCPFLQKDHSCQIKDYKPIMCLIYPIYFEPNPDDDTQWEILVDDICPLSEKKQSRQYFENEGKNLVKKLNISSQWLEKVYLFDEFDFDYTQMTLERDIPIGQYKIYELEDILKYRIEDL